MRATIVARYGAPVEVVDASEPELRARDVMIAVRAASLNPLDFKIRDGKVKLVVKLVPPIHLGCDVAGVVTKVGPEVTKLAIGDEVFARLEKDRMGGLAERVAADERVVAKKPRAISFEQAAAIPLAGLTSLQALRESAGLTRGQRVLVHAGAGGVGSLAIQIAKQLGLWVATTTSGKNVDFVKSLGADEVVDYTKEKITDRLKDLDGVFDTLGGQSELDSLAVIKRGGTVVGIGGMPDASFAKARLPWFAGPVIWFATRKRRAAAARAGAKFVYLFMRPDGAELAELGTWLESGAMKAIIHKAYPLADVREAFAELERGHARGKIVITM